MPAAMRRNTTHERAFAMIERFGLLRALTLAVLTLGGLYLAPALYRNYTGICQSQNRFLSEDELFAAVIAQYADHSKELNGDKSPEAIARFRKNNPDCCRVAKDFDNDAITRTILGGGKRLVEVIMEVGDRRRRNRGARYENLQIPVSGCGGIFGEDRSRGGRGEDTPHHDIE